MIFPGHGAGQARQQARHEQAGLLACEEELLAAARASGAVRLIFGRPAGNPRTGPSAHPPGLRHSRSPVAAGRAFAVLGGQVCAAAVGIQPVKRDHVHGDDGQRAERVGRDEEHHVDGVEPDHGHREPAGQLVAPRIPSAATSCRTARMSVIHAKTSAEADGRRFSVRTPDPIRACRDHFPPPAHQSRTLASAFALSGGWPAAASVRRSGAGGVHRRRYLFMVAGDWHAYDNPGPVMTCLGLRGHL